MASRAPSGMAPESDTGMARLLSVNLAVAGGRPTGSGTVSGIDKRPVAGRVEVRAPGPKGTGLGSGLVGDAVVDGRHHGGHHQAVYAYAREDLDTWAAELGRELPPGVFGENLTTCGLDVTAALIGERWRIGDQVVLEVSAPRVPCGTFAAWMADRGWSRRFTVRAVPGAYLRVIQPGQIGAGDPIAVTSRPEHDVTVGVTFRALTREPELLPRLLAADALEPQARRVALRRTRGRATISGSATPAGRLVVAARRASRPGPLRDNE